MNKTLLIALFALAGFTTLPATAADPADTTPVPENLGAPSKPCAKPGMGMGAGIGPGMGGMKPMMGDGRACPKTPCNCPQHAALSARVEQLEKRIDALQMTVEILARQSVK